MRALGVVTVKIVVVAVASAAVLISNARGMVSCHQSSMRARV